jgi:hypothetical protein
MKSRTINKKNHCNCFLKKAEVLKIRSTLIDLSTTWHFARDDDRRDRDDEMSKKRETITDFSSLKYFKIILKPLQDAL